ncbi:hypothetical protein PENTCL1PPCAC_3149, partial [Pristionchus entomophagus]
KGDNIVVNEACQVKVLDFGLARLINPAAGERMSAYVVTRWYRAPEIVLGIPYTNKVDVWSIGCIIAELINHQVLFPGMDRTRQWAKIVNVLGSPSEQFISQLPERIATAVRSINRVPRRPIEEIVPDHNFLQDTERPGSYLTADNARNLISKMLEIDPNERYSVAEALRHPYVRVWYKEEEVNAPLAGDGYDRDLDEEDLTLEELKTLIFEEVKRFEKTHDVFGDACTDSALHSASDLLYSTDD